ASDCVLEIDAEPKRNGYQYRCTVSNNGGSVVTDIVTLNIRLTPLKIIFQPNSDYFSSPGEEVDISINTTGAISFQWYYRTSPTANWVKSTMTGATSDMLIVPAAWNRNGYQYRCVITNGKETLISNTATLHVE
ncbi:MAG: hypothetical protein IIY75_01875, partial [Erysipelotrichales bacterium]|nr:hypothetical protein [Erysipelotrichales bacterium]